MLLPIDYNCIGIVAQHCNIEKLCIAENEAEQFDVSQLYCSNWMDILTIWNEINDYRIALAECEAEEPPCENPPTEPDDYALKVTLIDGGVYEGCNGKEATQQGVKKVLTYYSYGRYTILNGFNDTSTGMVTKTNDFSVPKTLKELEGFADKYRNMGLISFENTIKFLCANKETFTWFNSVDCKYKCGCDCNSNCGGTKARGYGMRSNNISK
jgi:hypothetical protein